MPTLRLTCILISLMTPTLALAQQCEKGEAMDERDGWEWIENNAVRTADSHAVENNPAATYVLAEANAYYQIAGEHEGEYLVMVQTSQQPVAFAVLKPNFNFCSDPAALDDEDEDLFEVVSAKLGGIPY